MFLGALWPLWGKSEEPGRLGKRRLLWSRLGLGWVRVGGLAPGREEWLDSGLHLEG